VTGDGEQIDAPGCCVDGDLPGRLGGVGVEQDAAGMGDAGQFGDGLQHTGLVVCCHDRHQHGLRSEGMLTGLGDDLRRCGPVAGKCGVTDGEVVGLGSARGEHDVSWLGADQVSESLPGLGQRAAGPLGVGVAAGRIAEMRGQEWQRGLGHPGVDRCGGVVVEIDGPVGQPRVMAGDAEVVHAGSRGYCI
jgi:hypothetical protein